MNKVVKLLTFLSLAAAVVSIERFSPTTKLILQPYSFLRLHEVFQISVVIFIGVILSFLLLKEITNNFSLLKDKVGTLYGLMFLAGIYFYGSGNGLHEVSSYLFNTFCNATIVGDSFCGAAFFNDYYFGNFLFFFGFLLSNLSIVLLELRKGQSRLSARDTLLILINSSLFAVSMIAYAGFDRVSVGLWFLLFSVAVFAVIIAKLRKTILKYPFTLYCSFAYPIAALISFVIRAYFR